MVCWRTYANSNVSFFLFVLFFEIANYTIAKYRRAEIRIDPMQKWLLYTGLFENLKEGILVGIIALSKIWQQTISVLTFEKVDFKHLSRSSNLTATDSFDWLSWQLVIKSFSFLTADFRNIWRLTVNYIETIKNMSSIFMRETNSGKINPTNIPQYVVLVFLFLIPNIIQRPVCYVVNDCVHWLGLQ